MIELNENFSVPSVSTAGKRTFKNPMGDEGHPDPCIVYCEKEKCYFGISTSGDCSWGTDLLVLRRSEKFEDMFVKNESRLIYKSNEKDDTYGYLWAPELQFIKGTRYIYTSCHRAPESSNPSVHPIQYRTIR